MGNGSFAVFVANHGPNAASVSIDFNAIPGVGPPPPPPFCPAGEFSRDLGDVQCFGLETAPAVNGEAINSEAGCCAACDAAGAARCETWQYCPAGKGCAGTTGVPLTGGCYIGKMGSCKESNNGWVSRARSAGPVTTLASPLALSSTLVSCGHKRALIDFANYECPSRVGSKLRYLCHCLC